MTRKDYPMLAEALKNAEPNGVDYSRECWRGWYRACVGVADALARDNRSFDRNRFLKDCGMKGE